MGLGDPRRLERSPIELADLGGAQNSDPPEIAVADELPIDSLLLRARLADCPAGSSQVVALRVLLDLSSAQKLPKPWACPQEPSALIYIAPSPHFARPRGDGISGDTSMNDQELMAQTRRAFERYHVSIGSEPWLRGIDRKDRCRQSRCCGPRHVRAWAARGLALAAAGSLLAGAFHLDAAPTGPRLPFFASWQRVPTAADPSLLQWALQNCPITYAMGTYPTTLVLQDQRGKAAFFVFADGDDFSTCLGADPQGRGGMFKARGIVHSPSGDPIEWSGGIQGGGGPA